MSWYIYIYILQYKKVGVRVCRPSSERENSVSLWRRAYTRNVRLCYLYLYLNTAYAAHYVYFIDIYIYIYILFIVLLQSPFQEQRALISRAFHEWIRECHDAHDKQVRFIIISFFFVLLFKHISLRLPQEFLSSSRGLTQTFC